MPTNDENPKYTQPTPPQDYHVTQEDIARILQIIPAKYRIFTVAVITFVSTLAAVLFGTQVVNNNQTTSPQGVYCQPIVNPIIPTQPLAIPSLTPVP